MHVGVCIEYLPAYSPDFNPIEQVFSVIKSHLHRVGIHFFNEDAAYYEMYRSFQMISPAMTYRFFRHSGYFLG
jgi:transposase